MTLIQCSECESEISDQAPACPHCGLRIRPSMGDRLSEAWKGGLHVAQRGAVAYPITWAVTGLISFATRQELYVLGEIAPQLLLIAISMAVFGFLVSALAILAVAWIRQWVGTGKPEKNIWARASLTVAVTWFFFAAWLVLTM